MTHVYCTAPSPRDDVSDSSRQRAHSWGARQPSWGGGGQAPPQPPHVLPRGHGGGLPEFESSILGGGHPLVAGGAPRTLVPRWGGSPTVGEGIPKVRRGPPKP